MVWAATAVIGSAVIGGLAQNHAANTAASAQTQASQAGIAEQQRQFDQVQRLLAPYVSGGNQALAAQMGLLGLQSPSTPSGPTGTMGGGTFKVGPDGMPQFVPAQAGPLPGGTSGSPVTINGNTGNPISQIESSPIYKGMYQQGEDAILQNASATGGLRGGNTESLLAQYRPQLLNHLIQQRFNNLGSITSMGQNAAAGVGNAGMSTGNNISNLYGQQGAANAGAALAGGQAIANVAGSIPTALAFRNSQSRYIAPIDVSKYLPPGGF